MSKPTTRIVFANSDYRLVETSDYNVHYTLEIRSVDAVGCDRWTTLDSWKSSYRSDDKGSALILIELLKDSLVKLSIAANERDSAVRERDAAQAGSRGMSAAALRNGGIV